MSYSVKKYDEVFCCEQISINDYLENLRDKGIAKYRMKIVKSGKLLEVEIFPLFKASQDAKVKIKPTRKAQKDLNRKNTQKRVSRLIHSNFSKKDIWCTFTYDPKKQPKSEKEALRDMQNYFRRLKRFAKKNGLQELKYIYVTEYVWNEGAGTKWAHHHVIMNFPDRDIAENFWKKGRAQARRLQPDADGSLDGMANYITKEKQDTESRKHSKTYNNSLNLTKPDIVTLDNKIRKRKAASIAKNQNDAPEIFENMLKGYRGETYKFINLDVKYSQYVSGVYIYARMMQKSNRRQ